MGKMSIERLTHKRSLKSESSKQVLNELTTLELQKVLEDDDDEVLTI